MKRILTWILIILLLGVGLKSCIRKDIPTIYSEKPIDESLQNLTYPLVEKNKTIDGIDYLQSQAPVGNYGGELIISTIGEGPKTLNPCNTKDATFHTSC